MPMVSCMVNLGNANAGAIDVNLITGNVFWST